MNPFSSTDITLSWCDKNFADLTQEQAKLMRELKDIDESDAKRHKAVVGQLRLIQSICLSLCKLRTVRKAFADAGL